MGQPVLQEVSVCHHALAGALMALIVNADEPVVM